MTSIKTLALINPTALVNPDPKDTVTVELWKMELCKYNDQVKVYCNFKSTLYNLIFRQCIEALQDCLQSHEDFSATHQDGITLLMIIKKLLHSYEETRDTTDALADIKEQFYSLQQGQHMPLQQYRDKFKHWYK